MAAPAPGVGQIRSDAETGEFNNKEYLKLSDTRCPENFRAHFESARQAIENDDVNDFQNAVEAMKGTIVPSAYCLNVCEMVPNFAADPPVYMPMTLMAFAGYYARYGILKYLISKEAHGNYVADIDMGNKTSGTPLLQMMMYAIIQKKPEQLKFGVVQFFIRNNAVLSRVLTTGGFTNVGVLEMAISMCRFDIALKLVFEHNVDPIYGGDPNMKPIFVEYGELGTNRFIKMLLKTYHEEGRLEDFIRCLLNPRIFSPELRHTVTVVYGRNAVHSFLLSGHEEAICTLVRVKPGVLGECDKLGRTALHVAAEQGDRQSVDILLKHNMNLDVKDKRSRTPVMLAAMKEHDEVLQLLIRGSDETSRKASYKKMWPWALQNGYATYFEAMHNTAELEDMLKSPLDENDSDQNTIAHLAADGGHVAVFKATFPKTHGANLFEILTIPNGQNKTPLQLAIVKGNIGILMALQGRRADRERQAAESEHDLYRQQTEAVETREWPEFWGRESPQLLLYACLHGTVEIVKYFVHNDVSPTTRANLQNLHRIYTPLACAARAGKHEIVAYLLRISSVSATGFANDQGPLHEQAPDPLPEQYSPLILASKHGHAKCVTILFENGADIEVRSERGYNCLMECIKAGHEDVARAILKHQWANDVEWKSIMNSSVKKDGKWITTFSMLISQMPELLKIVFTKCLRDDGTQVTYDFEFIDNEPQQPERESPAPLGPDNAPSWLQVVRATATGDEQQDEPHGHPLTLMVKHKQLNLLQHPLIARYIAYKWWRLSPFFFIYLFMYAVFLVLLTAFALIVPRPGPNDEYCPSNSSGYNHTTLIFEDDQLCNEPDKNDRVSFGALAVIIILVSFLFLAVDNMVELWVCHMTQGTPKFLANLESLFLSGGILRPLLRSGMFFLTIIFVFLGFVNDCWCAPPWQWQIGALAVFMAYINFLYLLKGLPLLGVYIPINMLFNIVTTFLKLIYLPILLILSFAFPFYMLFVRNSDAVMKEGILEAFSTPGRSFINTMIQSAGVLDFQSIFNNANSNLVYTPMAYILFFTFVVLMPILFITLLTGLAVGTTKKDTENATFINIKLRVNYIVGLQELWRFPCANLPDLKFQEKSMWARLRGKDYETQKRLVEDTKKDTFDSDKKKESLKSLKKSVSEMTATLQEKIPAMERSLQQLQERLVDHIV